MKRLATLIVGFALIISLGCSTTPTPTDPCSWNRGYEYVVYNQQEFFQYLLGYNAMIRRRFTDQKHGWFKYGVDGDPNRQIVYINLFLDHKGWYLYGWYDATRKPGGKVWIETTTWVCDVEGNVIAPETTDGAWAEWTLED